MKKHLIFVSLFCLYLAFPAHALDPVADIAERKFGMIFIKTPNADDVITLTSLRDEDKKQKVSPETDVKIRIGDYRVTVDIKGGYVYNQDVIVRGTERHEVIVPGYGNLRVNGRCSEVTILQNDKKVMVIKCNEIRTLPRGSYDLKIQVGKFTLDQNVMVVTNTLRELDVR